MDTFLTGKTAYVTGGAQGIGAAIVGRLVAEGARVAVSDLSASDLKRNRDAWVSASGDPVLIQADLSTQEGVEKATARVLEGLGGAPDILVNNVGAAKSNSRAFVDIDDETWDATLQLNLMSHVRTCRTLVPLMAKRGEAAVINISSDLAKQPEIVPVDYGVAKAGVLYLSKALSIEFAPAVRVNAILPGPVWTGLWSKEGGVVDQLATLYGVDRDQALKRYLEDRHLPMGIAEPDDVAAMVAFLASPLARRINGAAIDVGGTIRSLL